MGSLMDHRLARLLVAAMGVLALFGVVAAPNTVQTAGAVELDKKDGADSEDTTVAPASLQSLTQEQLDCAEDARDLLYAITANPGHRQGPNWLYEYMVNEADTPGGHDGCGVYLEEDPADYSIVPYHLCVFVLQVYGQDDAVYVDACLDENGNFAIIIPYPPTVSEDGVDLFGDGIPDFYIVRLNFYDSDNNLVESWFYQEDANHELVGFIRVIDLAGDNEATSELV